MQCVLFCEYIYKDYCMKLFSEKKMRVKLWLLIFIQILNEWAWELKGLKF